MAVNFEAANMVGYNNPKIEVFKAIINYETNAIIEAPSKTKIKSCLKRGAIPYLACASDNGSEVTLLWLSGYSVDPNDELIAFGEPGFQIMYLQASEQPIFKI